MGCFSYICKKTGKAVASDSFSGDAVYIFRLEDGEVKEIMYGHYDSYGRVFDNNGDSFRWDKNWNNCVTDHFDGDEGNGFAVILASAYDGVLPTTISEDDPDQGWGRRQSKAVIKEPYHMNTKGEKITVAEEEVY